MTLPRTSLHGLAVVTRDLLGGFGRAPVGHGGTVPVLRVLQMPLSGDFVARRLGILRKVEVAGMLGHGIPADTFGIAAVETGGAEEVALAAMRERDLAIEDLVFAHHAEAAAERAGAAGIRPERDPVASLLAKPAGYRRF